MWYSSGSLTPPHPAELVEHPVTAPVAPEALLEMERGPLLRLEFLEISTVPRLEDHQAAAWALAGYAFDWRERCGLDTRARCKLGKLETQQTKHVEGKKTGQTHCFGCSCSFQKKLLKIQKPKISMLFQVSLCFKVSDSICIWASNNAPGASEMLMPHLSHIVTSSLVLCFNFSICFPYVPTHMEHFLRFLEAFSIEAPPFSRSSRVKPRRTPSNKFAAAKAASTRTSKHWARHCSSVYRSTMVDRSTSLRRSQNVDVFLWLWTLTWTS